MQIAALARKYPQLSYEASEEIIRNEAHLKIKFPYN